MASGGAPASEQEQDILAGYLGWGGLADAFDPGKDNWHTEYEQLKDPADRRRNMPPRGNPP